MAMEKNFDAAKSEAAIFEKWEKAGAFRAGANKSRDEAFTIMIPPPNVTGALHVGHAFNNTLQDIMIRWHRMRGFDTLWQPGQDHAGIATQLQVEKQLAAEGGPTRAEMGRDAFLQRVHAWKDEKGGTIISQLKRLGASADWERNAFTMDKNFHDAVLKVFVDLYNKGLIYRGKRLVNWDPHFETAISDLEVENIEIDGHMWHFKYPLAGGETYEYVEKDEDGNVTLRETRDYISIATTRPETMLGDGAVAVHTKDERYAPIVGKLCEIPVGPKEHRRLIPIITDDYPDPEFGSGAVKITGAHDANDYGVAKRNNIPLYRLMDTKARMRDDGMPYAQAAERAGELAKGAEFTEADVEQINLVPDAYRGMDRFEARKAVIADIDAEGLMIEVEDKKIMQPFCDRSKVVMEPMLTDQWYVDAAKLAVPALEKVKDGTVRILPERDKKVYYHWMENIEPWCISRQLWWGHQIPVWYGPRMENGQIIPQAPWKEFCAANESDLTNQTMEYYGGTVLLVDEEPETVSLGGPLGLAGAVPVWRDPDVLDTWFSSGLWPIGTLGWPNDTEELKRYFPTSTLITGFDILFFWVARMMMMQLEVVKEIPFDTIYLHALVRDEKGVKMSKTLGNVVDPLDLIDEFGADALRFTMTSMAALGGTLKLSVDRVKGNRNFGTKLWNAARFAEFNEATPQPDFDPAKVEQTLNKWIVGETAKVREVVDTALEQYRFNDAANGLYAFVWGKVCDWYVELSKPLLQGDDEAAKAETKATLSWTLDQCLILLHPIMPFITEQLWGDIAERQKMLIHADWPTYGAELVDAEADREMNWVIGLIEQVRSVRSEMRVNAGAKILMVQLALDDAGKAALDRNLPMIMRLARISELTAADEAPKGAVTLPVEGGSFCLPLADVIDIEEEKARLQKAIDKLAKEIGGLKGKLANEKFVANAPEAVVAENRDRLEAAGVEQDTLQAAFDRVAALG
ncbi:valine--tRNA ligase [Neptunicoccus cionae]|uniref:valine--tRNA ligase n=1 Tax=Neptunicoccus cionae TaxID=2035344 RepID=UPI000C760312|nr:valine--tRNA ligase [Amylibacter cionae]PLS23542.1 valine--tRNA ligase [Amylibacter cionae]